MIPQHRCANCYVAQYQMKSNVPCKNEWWARWDAEQRARWEATQEQEPAA